MEVGSWTEIALVLLMALLPVIGWIWRAHNILGVLTERSAQAERDHADICARFKRGADKMDVIEGDVKQLIGDVSKIAGKVGVNNKW